jgi:hypothetical protein
MPGAPSAEALGIDTAMGVDESWRTLHAAPLRERVETLAHSRIADPLGKELRAASFSTRLERSTELIRLLAAPRSCGLNGAPERS